MTRLLFDYRSESFKIEWYTRCLLGPTGQSLQVWLAHGGSIRVQRPNCAQTREETQSVEEKGA